MVSRVQNIRSTNKNARPPNSTRQPGEFFVNFADKQFGVIDTAQVPQDLIAIRFFSTLTDYVLGDHVIYNGRAYRAKGAIPAGNFNAAQWETAGMADAPSDNWLYGRVNGAWERPEITDILTLPAELALKAPLASPALSGTPTAPTAAAATSTTQVATTAFVKSQNYAVIGGAELTARVAKAGDTMTGALTLSGAPTQNLHAATKLYVDQKPSGANTADTAPSSPVNGQMWWETDTGALFVFYDDGNSQAWVQLNGEMGNAVQKTGDTMIGDLTIAKASPLISLNKSAGSGAYIQSLTAGKTRWGIQLGDAAAETGSNIGSNFQINNYDDAGVVLSTVLAIQRSTGNVFIPSTTPSTSPTTGALTVAGGVGVGGNIISGAAINAAAQIAAQGFGTRPGLVGPPGGNSFNINWAGQAHLWIDGTNLGVISTSSDYRIKKDIIDLPSTWDIIKNLRPISYTQAEFTPPSQRELDKDVQEPFIAADDIERWGFIAHELQEDLLPSAASGTKDAPDAIQSINLAPVVAALTKALQEAMTRIEALEGSAAQVPTQHNKKGA